MGYLFKLCTDISKNNGRKRTDCPVGEKGTKFILFSRLRLLT